MKDVMFIMAGVAAIGVLVGLVTIAYLLLTPSTPEPQVRTCERFAVALPDPEYGIVYMGYADLCGSGLKWGNVQGPMSNGFKNDGTPRDLTKGDAR